MKTRIIKMNKWKEVKIKIKASIKIKKDWTISNYTCYRPNSDVGLKDKAFTANCINIFKEQKETQLKD